MQPSIHSPTAIDVDRDQTTANDLAELLVCLETGSCDTLLEREQALKVRYCEPSLQTPLTNVLA